MWPPRIISGTALSGAWEGEGEACTDVSPASRTPRMGPPLTAVSSVPWASALPGCNGVIVRRD